MYILGNKTLNSEIRRGSFLMLAQTTVILTVAEGGTSDGEHMILHVICPPLPSLR